MTTSVKEAGIIQLWKGLAPIVIFPREFVVHSRGNKLELIVVTFSAEKIGTDSEWVSEWVSMKEKEVVRFSILVHSFCCWNISSVVRTPTQIISLFDETVYKRGVIRRRIAVNDNAITKIILILLIYVHHNNINLYMHRGKYY